MSDENCWFCDQPHLVPKNDIGKCANCLVDIDRVPYEPITESLKEEEEMLLANFVKVTDYQTGDTLKFCDEGNWIESKRFKYTDGNPQQQLQFLVEDESGAKKTLTVNKTNKENLVKVWGLDTKNWVGKVARITIKEVEVAGKDTKVIRLEAIV